MKKVIKCSGWAYRQRGEYWKYVSEVGSGTVQEVGDRVVITVTKTGADGTRVINPPANTTTLNEAKKHVEDLLGVHGEEARKVAEVTLRI